MTSHRWMTRRRFLTATAAGAAAAPMFVRRSAFGANDRITAGIIGRGGPAGGGGGGTHLLAVCDVREDKVSGFRGNKEVKVYRDFRELLTRDDIDTVFVGTPDHWHALASIASAKAGKDIYCEKPMTLTIREGRAMVDAVRRYDRVFQTGSQQRSEYGGKFRFACEMVRSGRIGTVQRIHVNVGGPSGPCYLPPVPVPDGIDWDMWLGPAPWRPFHPQIGLSGSWRAFRDYSGGGMTDWGHHHFDIVQWALDMDESGPVEVHPPDGKDVKLLTYLYKCPFGTVEVYHGGAHGAQIEFIGTEGRVMVDRGTLQTDPPGIMATPTQPNEVPLEHSPGHKQNWADCVRSRKRPICDVEIGCRSVTVCHLGNLAYWLKRPIKWDPVKEEILGDPEAARWLDRPKRPPWHI